MAETALIGYNVTTHSKAASVAAGASLNFNVNVKSPAIDGDVLSFALTFTAIVKSALAAAWRLIGALVEIDRGDGLLSPVTEDEIGPTITISGGINQGRTASFTRRGGDLSPLLTSAMTAQRRVKVTGYRGLLGRVIERPVFDGYTREGQPIGFPPVAQIEAQDASIKYAAIRLHYHLEQGEGKSRRVILQDIFLANTIPVGTLDLGPDDGGIIFKGIDVGGDSLLLEWLKSFLSAIGREYRFDVDGNIHIARYDETRPAHRTIRAADAIVTIGQPPTNTPNVVAISSSLFSYRGPTGERTVKDPAVIVVGPYAPLVAVNKQNHLTGAITATGLASAEADQEISRKEVESNYSGGTLLYRITRDYGWYAPRACVNRQNADGTVSYNNVDDVFQYADQSWRTIASEQYGLIRLTILKRTFDEDGFLQSERTEVAEYQPLLTPIAEYIAHVYTSRAVLVTELGEAWTNGKEIFTFNFGNYGGLATTRTFGHDDRGLLTSIFIGTEYFGPLLLVTQDTAAVSNNPAYAFGPFANKRYALGTGVERTGGSPITITRFEPIDEHSHLEIVTTLSYRQWLQEIPVSAGETRSVVAGPIPFIETLTSRQEAQEASIKVRNEMAIDLAQGIEIEAPYQNDYCETAGELEVAGRDILRDLWALPVTVETPIDWRIADGDVLEVVVPEIGADPVPVVVRDWTHTFTSGRTPDFRSRFNCKYYPPHLSESAT